MEGSHSQEIKQRVLAVRTAWIAGGLPPKLREAATGERKSQHKPNILVPVSYKWVPRDKRQGSDIADKDISLTAPRGSTFPSIKKHTELLPEINIRKHPCEHENYNTRGSVKPGYWHLLQSLMSPRAKESVGNGENESEQERNLIIQQIQEFLSNKKVAVQRISAEYEAIVENRSIHVVKSSISSLELQDHPELQTDAEIDQKALIESMSEVFQNTVDLHKKTADIVGTSIPEKDLGKSKALMKEFERYIPKREAHISKPRNREKRKSLFGRSRAQTGHSLEGHRADLASKESALVVSSWNLVPKVGASKIDFNPLEEFCRCISTNLNLTDLNMSCCRIMAHGAAVLSPVLSGITTLTALNLSSNELRCEGMAFLAPSFCQLSRLRVLSLYGNVIGDPGLEHLASYFDEHDQLEHLELGANNLSSASQKSLKAIIDVTTQLSFLGLSNNVTHFSYRESKGPEFADSLSRSLISLSSLTSLDLSSNSLFHSGAKCVARYLYNIRSHGLLTVLDLGGMKGAGNRVGPSGMKALGAALYCLPLTHLIISYNELGEEGAYSLATATSVTTSLVKLDLRGNQMGSNGIKQIHNTFARNSGFEYIDLAENMLCYEAADTLANSLACFSSLTHLDLSSNILTTWKGKAESKTPKGIFSICQALLHANAPLHFLDLRDNGLDDSCRPGLISFMTAQNSMTSFNDLNLREPAAHWKIRPNLQDFDIFFVARRLWQLGITSAVSTSLQFNTLDLSGCDLLDFPEPVLKLRGLETLNLSHNHFRHIPIDQILNMRFLCRLNLKGCRYLLQPPSYAANQSADMTLPYLQGCRRGRSLGIPIVLIGDNGQAREILMQALTASERSVSSSPEPNGSRSAASTSTEGNERSHRCTKELFSEELSEDVQECLLPGLQMPFQIWNLGSVGHLKLVRDFLFVQRAIYTICLDGSDQNLAKEVKAWLEIISKAVPRAPVIIAIVHRQQTSVEQINASHDEASDAVRTFTTTGSTGPCHLAIMKIVSVDSFEINGMASFIQEVQAAKTELLGNTEWIHSKHQKVLQILREYKASHQRQWMSWLDFNHLFETAVPTHTQFMIATEYLHSVGVIRCIFHSQTETTGWAEPQVEEEPPIGGLVFLRPAALVHAIQSIPVQAGKWNMSQLIAWAGNRHGAVGPYLSPVPSLRFVQPYAAAKLSQGAAAGSTGNGLDSPWSASDGFESFDPALQVLDSFLPSRNHTPPDVQSAAVKSGSSFPLAGASAGQEQIHAIPEAGTQGYTPSQDSSMYTPPSTVGGESEGESAARDADTGSRSPQAAVPPAMSSPDFECIFGEDESSGVAEDSLDYPSALRSGGAL